MEDESLAAFLDRVGAQEVGGEVLAPCPLFDKYHPDTSQNPYKVVLSRGHTRPLLIRCRVCGDARGSELLAVWRPPHSLTDRASPDEIEALWRGSGWEATQRGTSGTPPAGWEFVGEVYAALLDRLGLTERHGGWLAKRGLSREEALRFGYRSTPDPADRDALAADFAREFGSELRRVPGFLERSGRWSLVSRSDAVFTPVRGTDGVIGTLKQRLFGGRDRMRLLSSKAFGGAASRNQCHCPLGVGGRRWESLWLTEGERKADVVWLRTGEATLSVPGVTNWKVALPAVERLLDVKGSVVLAFDRDGAGSEGTRMFGGQLAGLGYRVREAVWEGAKGVDDALVAGRAVTVSEWKAPQHPSPSHNRPVLGLGSEDEVLGYLRRVGPRLRSEVNAHHVLLSRLIHEKKVVMGKTKFGQVLAVPEASASEWREYLSSITEKRIESDTGRTDRPQAAAELPLREGGPGVLGRDG